MFAIIDTETTGGRPSEDRIMEIAIIIHNGKRVIESFSTLVNPQKSINPFVSGMTGITESMVQDAPLFEEISQKIWELTVNKIFVAHNVRFDYSMLRNEYKRLGLNFTRQQLCTVRLSRKFFPGLPSYSLGNLCESLGIILNNRHRALGDAEATALLFEKIILNDRKEIIRSELEEGLQDASLPVRLTKEDIALLPEETGIYYFLDENRKILYIGKSTNIKKRVISHFHTDLKSKRFSDLKERIASIDYQLTGSELLALLIESDEIKRFMPPFNIAQKKKKYRLGIFLRENEEGLLVFQAENLKLEEEPLIKVTTPRIAAQMLEEFNQGYSFNQVAHLIPRMKKLGTFESFRTSHNNKVTQMAQRFYFQSPNFIIMDEASKPDARSLIWVEDNKYRGYAEVPSNWTVHQIHELSAYIKEHADDPDKRVIIRNWMKRNDKIKVFTY